MELAEEGGAGVGGARGAEADGESRVRSGGDLDARDELEDLEPELLGLGGDGGDAVVEA